MQKMRRNWIHEFERSGLTCKMGALETMKLVGAKGVDAPRVRRNEEQPAQIENSEGHASRVEFVPKFGDDVGVYRSRQG